MLFIATTAFLGCLATLGIAQASKWESPDDPTVKFIIATESKWATSACSPQPDLKDIIADDFQGTSPSGRRYDREKRSPRIQRLCRATANSAVKVRFFGDSIAIAYGSESSMNKDNNGKETKHCLIWTDTWLKRKGQWQIVAAQDTNIPCSQ